MRLRFGEFLLDLDARFLKRGEETVHLPPKELQLLVALLAERPKALSKERLHELLWPATFVTEANLASVVANLRQALSDTAREPRFVRTVHGYGYAFCGEAAPEAPTPSWSHRLISSEREVILRDGANLLGRDREAAVWLDDPSVSRRHAQIVVTGESARLEDLGSKNGTWVAGEHVTSPIELSDGDAIHIGSVELVFRTFGPAVSTVTKSRVRRTDYIA